jgi:hypothetical protein
MATHVIMNSKFDELFSTEKLNQNWQERGAADKELDVIQKNRVMHNKFHQLQQLLVEKYGDISCLSLKIGELTEIINHNYPLNNTIVVLDIKEKERIVSLLEQLEDLIWAMSLSVR